jgi:hypothetical protein
MKEILTMKRTFEDWMKEVDGWLLLRCGLTHDDLPDWRYYDDYEDGVKAWRSAAKAIKYAQES